MRQKRLHVVSSFFSEETGVNLTPLIDVVFVVLILFILIAPLLEVDKITLAQGASKHKVEAIATSALTIHVQENNSIWINKTKVSLENILPILKAIHTNNANITPQLYQDEKAYFGTYQKIKNALEEAGFTELDVIVKNEAH